jgi:hypothetical protein
MRLRFEGGVPRMAGRLLRELGRREDGPSAEPGGPKAISELCRGVEREEMVLMLFFLLGGK